MSSFKRKTLLGGAGIAIAVAAGISVKTLLISPDEVPFNGGDELAAYYDSKGYSLDKVAAGEAYVPRLLLSKIPDVWDDGSNIAARKNVFYRTMLPLILEANSMVARDRAQILYLRPRIEKHQPIHGSELEWLRQTANKYKIVDWRSVGKAEVLDALERRVDVVPISLALVQAAVESAYGTSRFAREGNALFGQCDWSEGMEPKEKRSGKGDYHVASFKTPLQSIKAYLHNLNTHRAYKGFRARRAALRKEGAEVVRGIDLLRELGGYSEKGAAYLDVLSEAIRGNGLERFDSARLAAENPMHLVPVPRR